jgi:hypothetical protein
MVMVNLRCFRGAHTTARTAEIAARIDAVQAPRIKLSQIESNQR